MCSKLYFFRYLPPVLKVNVENNLQQTNLLYDMLCNLVDRELNIFRMHCHFSFIHQKPN